MDPFGVERFFRMLMRELNGLVIDCAVTPLSATIQRQVYPCNARLRTVALSSSSDLEERNGRV